MSQTFTDDLYEQSYVADTTLTNMENNFAALKSGFSGSAAPSNLVGFMLWGDTTSGHEILKRRNGANDAWLAILSGDASHKMWVYRNDTCEGWVIDATVTDRVLAIKGGSNAYNVNGGVNAGTWTFDKEYAHNHRWLNAETGGTHDNSFDAAGDAANIANTGVAGGGNRIQMGIAAYNAYEDYYTENSSDSGSTSTYRPAAAVGTLQYPDL